MLAGVVLGALLVAAGPLDAQAPAANKLWPNLAGNIERPLRYRPDHGDFVIENGAEFFNRPLYGGNTAFRIDGGDKPEFVLYLPGRGGNLRLGIHKVEHADPSAFSSAKWLHAAASITTRYRPGELLYEIRDPLLGPGGVLRLSVLAWHQTEGLAVRAEGEGIAPGLELVWAYGGVNGRRGARDGDIGTEKVPISEWFQLQPEFCRDNRIEFADSAFTLRAKAATIAGLVPAGARLGVADATNWNDLSALLDSVGPPLVGGPGEARRPAPALQVLVGRVALANAAPLYLSLERLAVAAATPDLDTYQEVGAPQVFASEKRAEVSPLHPQDLPAAFAATEAHFAALRNRVSVDTPDPYLNAAVGALNVAADAVWDEPQQAIMHGAIAWRTRLLGWRGPYALDALGWHDRARQHFEYWATRQNTDPIPAKLPPPDAKANLARSEAALHSNGDLSNSHYDMNLVFIDALFRHLLWTGDVEFAKKMWPVIERHLAWERRLFRREFTTAAGEKLPLYEAYAAIWASDDLQYSGGGTAHASAYNYWHNRMAARLAPQVGADPAPFAREADLIAHAMRTLLWTDHHFAESKDWLGLQLVHPSAALWTFYHTMDSGLPSPVEAGWMANYVACNIPHLPVQGPGVPDGSFMLASSDWMPYTWSLNNVVMGENVHAALGFWQAGLRDQAWIYAKGSLLASMFMGISPGNVGSMNTLDVYRREAQRDFADGSGGLSRAIVEGLFGVRPDALAGELLITPGFPTIWQHARLHHPGLDLAYRRDGLTDHYTIASRFARPMALRLQIPAAGVAPQITVNGQPVVGNLRAGPDPRLQILVAAAQQWEVGVTWTATEYSRMPGPYLRPPLGSGPAPGLTSEPVKNTETVDLAPYFNDRVTAIFQKGKYVSPRSPFVSLALPSQGIGYWAGHPNATAEIDDTGLRAVAGENGGRIKLPNGLVFATPGPGVARNILFTSQWDNYPREMAVPLTGKAQRIYLLMAGSTNAMQSRLDNGEVIVTYAKGPASRLALRNPNTWWPIEQDYFIDDYQFTLAEPDLSTVLSPLPTRVDLKTGVVRVLDYKTFKGQGGAIEGGAATVLELELDPDEELRSLTVRALANDVVIGLMAVTLAR